MFDCTAVICRWICKTPYTSFASEVVAVGPAVPVTSQDSLAQFRLAFPVGAALGIRALRTPAAGQPSTRQARHGAER